MAQESQNDVAVQLPSCAATPRTAARQASVLHHLLEFAQVHVH